MSLLRLNSAFLGLALALLPAHTVPAAGPDRPPAVSVRILSPSPGEVVQGRVTVDVRVLPPGGRKILRVDLFADGRRLASLRRPPFRTEWEAGEELASRVIRAVALFDDGSRAEDLVTTRGLRFSVREQVEATPIEHVELLISVTDEEGLPVRGLQGSDFQVIELGRPVDLAAFRPLSERLDQPLSVTMLVDRSGSMRVHMEKISRAAAELLSILRPVDQVRVSAFSDETVILQDFTRDPLSLRSSLDDLGRPAGGTRLFAAVRETVWDMRGRPGRKVIVALTDGLDTDMTSPSGPITTAMIAYLRGVVREAVREGVTIVVVLPGPPGRGYLAAQDLALQTGGWYTYPGRDFTEMIARLGERILGAYVAEYDVARPVEIDRKRPVEVLLSDGHPDGWEIRTAMGTYAGKDLFDALSEELKGGSPAQRVRAAGDLAHDPGPEVARLLAGALKDRWPGVRAAAVTALSRRRDMAAMERVLRRIHDSDPGVRRAAFEAAVRYGSPAVPGLMDEAGGRGESRLAALRALGSIGDRRAVPLLGESLRHRSCSVRAAAAEGAGRMLAALSGVPAGRDVGADERSGRVELREGLEALLLDPCSEAAAAAREALERLSPPESSTES